MLMCGSDPKEMEVAATAFCVRRTEDGVGGVGVIGAVYHPAEAST